MKAPRSASFGGAGWLHSYGHPRYRQQTSRVKNRMREICTSGSVRGEGGNILTYSAMLPLEWSEVRDNGLAATQAVKVAEERQLTRRVAVGEARQEEPPE